MRSTILSKQEVTRYKKLIAVEQIGLSGLEKLKQASVLVIGAGSLGAPVLQHLSSSGIGTLGILDNDLIEMKNLPGQVLYGTKDLGKHKTIVAKQKLTEHNHLVKCNIHNICLSPENAIGFLQDYDIVVDATDNFLTKIIINDACVILKKRWIYGHIEGFTGEFSVFDGKTGPTLRCLYPQKKPQTASSDEEFGILAGIIGSYMSSEVIKEVVGFSESIKGWVKGVNIIENSFIEKQVPVVPENLEIRSF